MDTFHTDDGAHARNRSALLILLGILVVTIGAPFLPASWFGIKPAGKTYQKVDLSALSLDRVAHDTNADGSISWKELVSDTLAPSDIAEIEKEQPDPKVIANLNDPNNLTASFSKNLYTASAYLSKNQVNDPAAQQDVINQLIAQEASKITTKQYTLKDLNISKTESKTAIKSYGNSVASILGDMVTQKSIQTDVESIAKFTNTNSANDLLPLQQDLARVDTKLAKLLALPIPMSAATYHVLVLTRVTAYRDSLYNLSQAANDPMRTMLFVQKYPEITLATLRTFSLIAPYFDVQNVVFSPNEPGYVFIVGYTLK